MLVKSLIVQILSLPGYIVYYFRRFLVHSNLSYTRVLINESWEKRRQKRLYLLIHDRDLNSNKIVERYLSLFIDYTEIQLLFWSEENRLDVNFIKEYLIVKFVNFQMFKEVQLSLFVF
jgi:hypothetical protein